MRSESYFFANARFSFGRKFDRDQFQDMCRTLRVLNAVRQFEIGIPLSIQQLKVFAGNFFQIKSAFFSLFMPSLLFRLSCHIKVLSAYL